MHKYPQTQLDFYMALAGSLALPYKKLTKAKWLVCNYSEHKMSSYMATGMPLEQHGKWNHKTAAEKAAATLLI